MPDHPDPFDAAGLPAWAVRALRAPVTTDPARKARLLALVRAGAPAGRARSTLAWRARRGLAPLAGLAAAAAVAGIAALGAARSGLPGAALHATLRDTVQRTLADTVHGGVRAVLGDAPRGALLASVVTVLPRDSAAGAALHATLRDTLRLVRFVLVAPTATRLALVGDFNRWDARATPLRAADGARGTWAAIVALPPGAHRYAFVVDDTARTADPAATGGRDAAGRAWSLVRVPGERR